jgi:sugar lactone lactonase YvrE
MRSPTGLYYDEAAQILYVADTGNHAIRAIDLSSGVAAATITTVAGTLQTRGFDGDGGPATSALLFAPVAVTGCPDGDLYIADTGNNRVRRVEAGTGNITTVLGEGTASSSGQGAPATSFPVDAPSGIACDAAGDVFVTSRTTLRMLPWASDAKRGIVDGTGPVETIYGAAPRTTFPENATS